MLRLMLSNSARDDGSYTRLFIHLSFSPNKNASRKYCHSQFTREEDIEIRDIGEIAQGLKAGR